MAQTPQDFMAAHNARTKTQPTPSIPAGHQSLGNLLADPPMIQAVNDWVANFRPEADIGFNVPGGVIRNILGMDPNREPAPRVDSNGLPLQTIPGYPAYLQPGYQGPNTGSYAGDLVQGLGDVFNFASGSGPIGGLAPVVAQVAGELPQAGSALGSFIAKEHPFFNAKNLLKASDLEKQGAKADRIWWETKTFRGPQQEWLQELPPNEGLPSSQIMEALDNAQSGKTTEMSGKLQQFFADPHYLAAFPDNNFDFNAKIGPGLGGGLFRPPTQNKPGLIQVETDNIKNFHEILQHEMEHGAQYAQGRPMGGNPENIQFEMIRAVPRVNRDKLREVGKAISGTEYDTKIDVPQSKRRYPRLSDEWHKSVFTLSHLLSDPLPTKGDMEAVVNWFQALPKMEQQSLKPLLMPYFEHVTMLGNRPRTGDAVSIYHALNGEHMAKLAGERANWSNSMLHETDPMDSAKYLPKDWVPYPGVINQFDPTLPIEKQLTPF